MTPLWRTCICSPPSSSFVTSYPSAAFTTGGPPGNSALVPFTIRFQYARQALTAGSPATEPMTAETTGTVRMS